MDQRTVNDLAGELRDACAPLGVPARITPDGVRPDGFGQLRVELDGRSLTVAVTTRADLRPASAKEFPAIGERLTRIADGADPVDAGLVFADRLAEHTRDILQTRGWGWLDRRRGNLRLWTPGVRLDTTVTPPADDDATVRVRDPFSATGRRLALWLLLHPNDPASPRGINRETGISPGQVSNLLAALSAEALLRRDRTPLVPELFWALVEHWKPRRHALLALPSHQELAEAPELQTARWVVSDTCAAAAYGAPVAVGSDYPPDLYVPDQKTLSWVLGRSTIAADFAQRAATVAIAPDPLVGDARFRRTEPGQPWPLAHPVVVALDLAVDRNRGREVVEQWDPDPQLEVDRVW